VRRTGSVPDDGRPRPVDTFKNIFDHGCPHVMLEPVLCEYLTGREARKNRI